MHEVVAVPVPDRPSPPTEAIAALEQSALFVPYKIDALLVSLGYKPATFRTVVSEAWNGNLDSTEVPEDEIQEYVDLTQNLGLYVRVQPEEAPYIDEHPLPMRRILVADSPDNLARLQAAYDSRDPRLLGEVFGYPETAVDAYVTGSAVNPKDAMPDLDPVTQAFTQYKVSPDHVAEELATGERWAAAVQVASPNIFDEYMRERYS